MLWPLIAAILKQSAARPSGRLMALEL